MEIPSLLRLECLYYLAALDDDESSIASVTKVIKDEENINKKEQEENSEKESENKPRDEKREE